MDLISPEKMAQIKSVLQEIDTINSDATLIKDNKILFPFNGKTYRVRMPSQNDEYRAEQAQNNLQIRLIQQDGTITKKRLIKLLKEKQDIDIEALEKEKDKIRKELQDVYLELAVVDSEDFARIDSCKLKKQDIENRFMEIVIEITEMLKPCIEEQVHIEYYRYLSFLCSEVCVQDELFEPIWKSYEDYCKDDTGLTHKALQHTHSLLINIKS